MSEPIFDGFSIKSERYELMKSVFLRIAKRVRKAMLEGQPIIIRHHNDADGIISGLSIELSCKGFMKEKGIDPEYMLYRSPSKAPFYETSDVFRDIVLAKRLEGFEQKKPLVLVLDNGSTPEDVFGMKALHTLGYEAIVIDHHHPVQLEKGETSVDPYLSMHLNPYKHGLDSKTSAGMLCYELGRMINEKFDNPIMPAIAAIADRCDIEERELYIQKSGMSIEELTRIGVAIDFVAYHMKFDAAKGLFEELLSDKTLVDMINVEVSEGVETQLQSTMPYLRTQDIKGVIFSHIDLEKYTLRFKYPTPGKVVGMLHDKVAEDKDHTPVLTLGYLSDMIIIRATKPILPVQKIIENLRRDLPEANVDGGGHEMAGTIKFVQAHLVTILENIKQQLRQLPAEALVDDA
jgi:RecJ-like exonuclease